MTSYIPFCGTPPLPSDLWWRWTFDPLLLLGLAMALGVGLRVASQRSRFVMGWGIAALLFVSPICAASMALFSARVGQHILLILVVAPVLASALPRIRLPAMPLAIIFAVLFWFWHVPPGYAATLESDLVYWTMHLSLLGAALLLFAAVFSAAERAVLPAALTAAQMTVLAVILLLSPRVWHDWHALTTLPYGLSALADQQLAGAIMWVAGGGLFLVVVAIVSLGFLREARHPA